MVTGRNKMRKIIPLGSDAAAMKLHDDISQILMKFLTHNQKSYSKSLQNFMAKGMHDIRAGLVSVEILVLVQKFIDETDK